MIDYFMQFNTEADAIAAAEAVGAPGKIGFRDIQGDWHWSTDHVSPNIQAWRISQDVTNPDGSITHTFLAGWYCIISLQGINAQLNNHPNLAFSLDRDGPPYVIKNNMGAVLTNLGYQPIFAGSHYPIGGTA